MPKKDPILEKVRKICLAFPDSKQTITWGKPHFRVGEKIFAGYSNEERGPRIGFKLTMEHADIVVGDPCFERAKYVGRKGWVSMDAAQVKDWDEVRAMIHESFTLIAPKRLVKKLSTGE